MKTFVVLSWVSLGLVLLVVPSCKSHKDVQAPPAAGAEQTWSAVATGSNAFAADLYVKLAAQEKGNLFFSPLSIHTALAMTYGGAASTTADQMAQTLHLSLPPDKLAHPYGELLSRVNAQPADGKPKSCELVLANALWGQAGYAFKQNFVATLQDAYGASLNQVNFGRPDAACAAINDWVAKHTNNKIREIVSGDSVNDQTRLILTNAIYFKGTWRTQFDPNETKDRPFQIAKDGWITVPMMHLEDRLGYLEQDDFQMVELPYLKNELSMFVIVPWKAENLARVEKSLTAANLDKWFKDAKRTLVDVTFPKFTSCTQFMLADTLRSMGMTDAFGGSADFSGMTDKNKLFISSVAHKAFVAVDEEGTEAAAATGGGMMIGMPKCEVFRADHPFIFVIRHNATGEILFMGRMANPGGPNAAVTSQPATAEALFVHSRPVRSIVFVIDRSGSMVDSFDALKEAILAHVCDRRPNQAFHIIMFGGERQAPIEMAGKKLVPATKASKQMAAEFLESMNATGTTDPKPAIKRAFEVLAGPDAKDGKLIVFLAGSDFGEDNEKVLALIKKLNPDREVMISPYLYSEHETKAGKELLEKIAQDNGGKYKFFSTNEAK